jgi:hypothetical protein
MAPIIYVDRSDIRPGKLDALRAAAADLARHVADGAPRVLSYDIFVSSDESSMTVTHLHPDAASLEELMAVLAPLLPPFRELLTLRTIDVYGAPSEMVRDQLARKVELLGGTVTIHSRLAGIAARAVAPGDR